MDEVVNEVIDEVVNEVMDEMVNKVLDEVVNEVMDEVVNEVVHKADLLPVLVSGLWFAGSTRSALWSPAFHQVSEFTSDLQLGTRSRSDVTSCL